jgi:hypothetical protein
MFTKDLERLVRTMARQKMDPEYVRYYLMETYQLTAKAVDEVFTTVGFGKTKEKFNTKNNPATGGGGKPAAAQQRKPFT